MNKYLLADTVATPTLLQSTLHQAYLGHHLCANMPSLTFQPLFLHATIPSIKCVAGVLQKGTFKSAGLQVLLIAARFC